MAVGSYVLVVAGSRCPRLIGYPLQNRMQGFAFVGVGFFIEFVLSVLDA
jgi:hypothetical protein